MRALCLLMIGGIALMAGRGPTSAQTQPAAGESHRLSGFPVGTRFLFQGDSITDGNRGRTADPNHILGHSYVFLIAAGASERMPEKRYEFLNRGISGNTVSALAKRWEPDCLFLKPDVLTILIGVNDLAKGTAAADYKAQYDALLRETRIALPNARFVLMTPFGLPTGKKKNDWPAYSAELELRREIVVTLARKHSATLIDLQRAFDDACHRAAPEFWIWDGIHPTYAGQQIIAEAWLDALSTPPNTAPTTRPVSNDREANPVPRQDTAR